MDDIFIMCQKSLDCLFGIAKSIGARDFDEANIRFIKNYGKESSRSLRQFSPQEEEAAFRSNDVMSFEEVVSGMKTLVAEGYHISWIDFQLKRIENGCSYIFVNVISSKYPVETKYHVCVNNKLINKPL